MKQPEIQEHYDPDKALVDECQLRGGKITLADTTARDNWPLDKRKIGMFVTIGTATKRYGGADVANTNWTNANNWFSILDKEYGDTLYKRRETEFIVKGVPIDENLVEIDVFAIAKLYMNGKYAFNVVAYATDPTPEKKVEIEILPVDASKFNVKGITDGFTGKVTLFVTFQEIIWDYEGVVTVGKGNPSGVLYDYGYTYCSYDPNQSFGSINPLYPKEGIGGSSGYRFFLWRDDINSTGKIHSSGNINIVEINGTLIYGDIVYYINSNTSYINSMVSNPFPAIGQLCNIKVKYA